MLESTDDFYIFFEECIRGEKVRPAEEGKNDSPLIGLINNIMGRTDDFIFVDYGCGKGRFIQAPNNLNSPNLKILEHMHYIGVDIDKNSLLECDRLAEELNFKQRVKKFQLKEPILFHNDTLLVDYVFLINTLHEMSALEVVPRAVPVDLALQDLLFKLGYKGSIIIHELKHLLSGEKEFITFDEEDILFLFKNIKGITSNIFSFRSKKRQIEMYNAYIIRTTAKFIPIEMLDLEYKFFELLKKKQIRLLSEITNFNKNKSSRDYAYLIALYTNVSKTIEELEANINIWSGGEVRCWVCGNIVTVERSEVEHGHEAVVICPNCGLRKELFKYRAFALENDKNYKMLRRYYPEEFERLYRCPAADDEIAPQYERMVFNISLEDAVRFEAVSHLGKLRLREDTLAENATGSLERIAGDTSLKNEIRLEAIKWLSKDKK